MRKYIVTLSHCYIVTPLRARLRPFDKLRSPMFRRDIMITIGRPELIEMGEQCDNVTMWHSKKHSTQILL